MCQVNEKPFTGFSMEYHDLDAGTKLAMIGVCFGSGLTSRSQATVHGTVRWHSVADIAEILFMVTNGEP